jgi:16S rRNA (guanine966-N2)-methyltransferase
MLKIIGGYLSGRNILSVPGEETRPPLARVREAVANILQPRLEEAQVLDLFAGTGSYSFELISRGARNAVLIDKNPKAVEVIKKNVARMGLENQVRVIRGDALKVIDQLAIKGQSFDIIIVAPPYFTGLDALSMRKLSQTGLLAPGAIVVLQQAMEEQLVDAYGVLKSRKTYKYGDTRITTYVVKDIGDQSEEPELENR